MIGVQFTAGAANLAAARLLVGELVACGVRQVVASPGARSTPMVVALGERASLELRMVTDERSAAYFALGLVHGGRRPVVLLSTSGTAAANFLPALAEASLSELPLIVITADRPPELRDCGAAQTIRQVGMFDAYARWSIDLVAPDASVGLEDYYRSVACRAVAAALEPPAGPVHINAPFREPLIDSDDASVSDAPTTSARPSVIVYSSSGLLGENAARELSDLLSGCERGVIVCGPRTGGDDTMASAIADLADTLDWPILADPLSGLRYRGSAHTETVDGYDVLLRSEAFVANHQPEVILRFGGLPSSKSLQKFLAVAQPAIEHVLIAGPGSWPDPLYAATRIVRASAEDVARRLVQRLPSHRGGAAWRESWLEASRTLRSSLSLSLGNISETFGGGVAAELVSALPDGARLFVGNSMAVRDLDTFAGNGSSALSVSGNRGANGIDGVVSTALGLAAAHGGATALLVGDLSFLHDIGGLQIAARHQLDLLVVVVNNDGGGIFSFLPQLDGLGEFERLFATPHGLDLEAAVRMCHGRFTRAPGWPELRAALAEWREVAGLYVVEVPCERRRGRDLHREVVERGLASMPGCGQSPT